MLGNSAPGLPYLSVVIKVPEAAAFRVRAREGKGGYSILIPNVLIRQLQEPFSI